MNIMGARQVGVSPEVYTATLPDRTGDIFVDLRFCAGFAHETPETSGLTHLLEHYLLGRAYRRSPEPLKVSGQVGDDATIFTLTASLRHAVRDAQLFFDAVLHPSFDDLEVFDSEREAMRNELIGHGNSAYAKLYERAGTARFSGWSSHFIHRTDELRLISRFSISDIARWYAEYFVATRLVVTVGAHASQARLAREVATLAVSSGFAGGVTALPLPLSAYSSRSVTLFDDPTVMGSYVAVTFPTFPFAEPLEKRLALRVLARLLTGSSSDRTFKALRSRGVYDLDYSAYTNARIGVLSFRAHIEAHTVSDLLTVLRDAFRRFKSVPARRMNIEDSLRSMRRGVREEWRSNGGRFEWITNALTYEFAARSPREYFSALRLVEPDTIRKLASEIFSSKSVNIVVLGDVVGIVSAEIDQIMEF